LDNASANTRAMDHLTPLLSAYVSTVVMSGVYYPTSPLMLHHILHINKHMDMYENDNLLRHIVVPMKDKLLKYWGTIPLLYAFAFILDPRAKIRGFNNVLALMSQLTHSDYSGYLTSLRADLSDLFNKYDDKFGSIRLQRTSNATPGEGKSKYAWDLVFGADGIGSSSSMALGAGLGAFGASSSSSMVPELSRRTSASALLHAASTPGISGSELAAYLDSDTVQKFDDEFSLLDWWHDHKLTYPVLSILAKDIISVPVSTVSSESAFSLAGRLIEERCRRLGSRMLEMLSLLKDWEAADARMQHTTEDKILEESFRDLFIN
jgi:hypothetical protein